MKPQVDYIWIVVGVGAVVLFLSWPMLTGLFRSAKGQLIDQDQLDRGKLVFYDDTLFMGEGSNRSCSVCHAADYTPPPGVKIDMKDYVEGQPLILNKIKTKYGTSLLTSVDPLFGKIGQCMSSPNRMGCGRPSRNAKHVQDLLEYVRSK